MTFESKTNTITVGRGSDFAADSGAFFIKVLRDQALTPSAPSRLKNDWRSISAWLCRGDGELTPADYERIGRAWRYYIDRGVAPSIALERPFQQMSRKVDAIQAPHEDVPPAVFRVFDRLLASDAEIIEKSKRDAIRGVPAQPKPSDGDWRMRFVGLALFAWFPLSFCVVPALAILGLRWIREGWPAALFGILALLTVLPPAFSLLLLEFRTVSRRPFNIFGTLLVVAYNTAVLVAARYLLR